MAIRKMLAKEESKPWSTEMMLMMVPTNTKHPFEMAMALRFKRNCPFENSFLAPSKRFIFPDIKDTFSSLKIGMDTNKKNSMIELNTRFKTNNWNSKLSTLWVVLSFTNRRTTEFPQEEPVWLQFANNVIYLEKLWWFYWVNLSFICRYLLFSLKWLYLLTQDIIWGGWIHIWNSSLLYWKY